VAFLRGMNLGGRRITNDDLRERFAELGFEGLATFRASGNVIFEAEREAESKLIDRIEKGLKKSLGYEVPVFLRTAAQITATAAHEPFTKKQITASQGKSQVGMLSRKPPKRAADQVLAMASKDDLLDLQGRELFWLPKGGLLETGLDLKLIAKLLGDMTVRTKGTIDLIVEKHFT
jgi:uncharacterized protein (DUF1697 family)